MKKSSALACVLFSAASLLSSVSFADNEDSNLESKEIFTDIGAVPHVSIEDWRLQKTMLEAATYEFPGLVEFDQYTYQLTGALLGVKTVDGKKVTRVGYNVQLNGVSKTKEDLIVNCLGEIAQIPLTAEWEMISPLGCQTDRD